MKHSLLLFFALVFCLSLNAQTVIDMHTGRVSGKTREDYNYKAREDWQIREDSIAYNDCLTRAFNYLYIDSLQAAQDLFERALKLRPDAPGNNVVRHNIGRIFIARKQWKDAASIFSRILQDESANIEVREFRAYCYYELKQYDKALRDYDYLVMLRPDEDTYRLLHATMLKYTGARLDAIDELSELITRNDNDEKDHTSDEHKDFLAECFITRAGIYIELNQKGYARADLDRAVALGIPKEEILDLYESVKAR